MKNSITDLGNHLFEQLERLNDESRTGDALQEEINRAKSIANVSSEIIKCGTLQYKAVKLALENKSTFKPESLPMIKDKNRNLLNSPKPHITAH